MAIFAKGIKQDLAAVKAAIGTEWSKGQVEGQFNRLKTIKRLMYGRANFDLLRAKVQYESQRKIREREKTPKYRKEYQRRSGIEVTISQAVRGFRISRSHSIGQAKTHLQQVVSATSINARES